MNTHPRVVSQLVKTVADRTSHNLFTGEASSAQLVVVLKKKPHNTVQYQSNSRTQYCPVPVQQQDTILSRTHVGTVSYSTVLPCTAVSHTSVQLSRSHLSEGPEISTFKKVLISRVRK